MSITTIPSPTARLVASVHAGEFAKAMLMAQRGNPAAIKALDALGIEAALSTVDTDDASGLLPPAYSDEVIGGLPVSSPFYDTLIRHTNLPATGMSVIRPRWETLPSGDWYSSQNTQPASNTVEVGVETTPVLSYAHAIRASIDLVERSDFGGFAGASYEQETIDYVSKREAKAIQVALADAQLTTSEATSAAGVIGDLVAAVITNQLDGDGNFRGLLPEYAAVAADVWSELGETSTVNGFAFGTGEIRWGQLAGSLNGLVTMLVPGLPAGGVLVGARGAVSVWDGAELRRRSLVVNTMSIELGVHANVAFNVDFPLALALATNVAASG